MLVASKPPIPRKPYDIDNVRPIKTLREAEEAIEQASERVELTRTARAQADQRARTAFKVMLGGGAVAALYPVWNLMGGKVAGVVGVALGATVMAAGGIVTNNASMKRQELWFDQQRAQNKLDLFESIHSKVQKRVAEETARSREYIEGLTATDKDDILDIEVGEGFLVVGDHSVDLQS